MTPTEFITRWRARRDQLHQLGAMVDGAALLDEILTDYTSNIESQADSLLSLTEAARLSGYRREHLGRLIKDGKVPNAGRPHAPKIRVADLPIKPGRLPLNGVGVQFAQSSKRQIVRSVADPDGGTR